MSTTNSSDDTSTSRSSQPTSTYAPTLRVALKTDIVVIGAGQTGLSSAYHLKKRGLVPNRGFVVLDQAPQPGGAWQFRWPDGTALRADVILWCTGFRSSLDHLAPLMLREPGGGITMTGKLATQVAKDPRVHLVGYGPSASTIGANRAGAAAARELMAFLGKEKR